jgi:glucokinase
MEAKQSVILPKAEVTKSIKKIRTSETRKMNLSDDKHVILTLDAGGTNFVFSAYRGGLEIVSPITLASNAHDLERCTGTIYSGFDQVISRLEQPADAISFAFPGPADYALGIIGDLPNFKAFNGGVPLGPMLEDRFRLPVFINNDGNLFAYGEALAGYLPDLNKRIIDRGGIKQFRNLVGLTLGTGFGCGIVLNNILLAGDNSNDAGIHNTSNRFNPAWNAEESVSTRAIQRVYCEKAGLDFPTSLMPKDIHDIAAGKVPGNREAAFHAFRTFGEALGNSVANMLTLIDGIVVIGGGLTAAWDLFAPSMFSEINRQYENTLGEQYARLSVKVFNLEDESAFGEFANGSVKPLRIPSSERVVVYDELQRAGIGLSKLSASAAIAIGANAFAVRKLTSAG